MRRVGFVWLWIAVGPWMPFIAQAAYLRDVPVTLTQPDGSTIDCFLTGDEYFRYAHDARGFVILQDPGDGRYVYAETSDAEWRPGPWAVGTIDPAALGLQPHPPVPAANPRERWELMHRIRSKDVRRGPFNGTLQNVVVFLRFDGETEFADAPSVYDGIFNEQGASANSMSHYYQEVSQGQLDIRTTFYPLPAGTVQSYESSHPRGFYQPRSPTNPGGYAPENQGIEGFQRLHALFQAAVQAVGGQVPGSLDLDLNDDGFVDNTCFIAKGHADNWSDVLWAHSWELMPEYPCSLNGAPVKIYTFQLQDEVTGPSLGNSVLCHEMFHSLSAPDLYRYGEGSGTFFPAWKWDLMDYPTNPPEHMLMYMKHEYGGWLGTFGQISTITQSGTYTLNPVTATTNNWCKIASPNSTTQFFIVEYRRQTTSVFEAGVPGSGLIVYRVNRAAEGNGNAQGPPDEILVYRPGGSNTTNGTPDNAHFNSSAGRTAINDQSNPAAILANGSAGGLDIRNIGAAGETITFEVVLSGQPSCATQPGDATGNGQVDIFDVVAVVNDILAISPLGDAGRICADMDAGGTINIFDVVSIVNRILNPGWPAGGEPGTASSLVAGEARSPALNRNDSGTEASPRRETGLEPLLVRCEQTTGGLRLRLDGGRVHGLEWSWPSIEAGDRASGALDGDGASILRVAVTGGDVATVAAAAARDGAVRGIAYNPSGRPLGAGEIMIEVPTPAEVGARAEIAEPGVAGWRLLAAGAAGEPIPIALRSADATVEPAARLLAIHPNPTAGPIRLLLRGGGGQAERVSITDVSGRTVRDWRCPASGGAEILWDGRDAEGMRVPSGVYFVTVGGAAGRRLLIVR